MKHAMAHTTRNPWLEPVFVFLFFFNTFLLPEGLTFSLLLAPVWLYLLYRSGRLPVLGWLLAGFLFYTVVHLFLGVALPFYFVSWVLLLGIGLFTATAYSYLNTEDFDIDFIFKRIVLLNFLLVLFCLPALGLPWLKPIVWYSMSMSEHIPVIARLKLFTSEASHYSYLLAPVFIYFCCRALMLKDPHSWPTLLMIGLPLLLSLSFGVLGCLLFSGGTVLLFYFNHVFDTPRRKRRFWLTVLLSLAVLALLFYCCRDNILFRRLANIFTGRDTSSKGRTLDSFLLAQRIAAHKSLWWGIGPGQLKVLGRNIIVQYYSYANIPAAVRIPNACAETILCFGYIGFALRIAAELVLFYATGVPKNPYRLWLFLFLFLFQFMGSYLTNTAEYIFWLLVFCPGITRVFVPHSSPGFAKS